MYSDVLGVILLWFHSYMWVSIFEDKFKISFKDM